MVTRVVVTAVCFWLACELVAALDRPTIGIVSLELQGNPKTKFPFYDAYIAASYVKAVESSGARVVPIIIGQSEEYYRKILSSINGLLFPGGGAYFNGTANYYSTSKLLYKLALEANDRTSFPILGICLGFELLLHVANHEKGVRRRCDMMDVNLPLQFEPKFKKSSLFRGVPSKIVRTLQTNATVNYHKWCIYPKSFQKNKLDADWKILSTSLDQSQFPFISSVQHKKYPIAGVQFHPEKHSFEWSTSKNYPHTPEAIEAGRFFFDWLVKQSKSNNHSFTSPQEESAALIYNYNPVFSLQHDMNYTQMYLFKTRWTKDQ